jgi:acyl carrier protein
MGQSRRFAGDDRAEQQPHDRRASTGSTEGKERSVTSETIEQKVKGYLMREFLPGEDPDELTATTPLISGGILDSIATLKLVTFLEDEYGVTFEPHEVDKENLDTIARIAQVLVAKKPTVAR